MRLPHLAAVLLPTLAMAQQQTGATALPAADSPEAAALFDKACAKMLAVGRGSFTTTEEQDPAMMRGNGMPPGMGDQSVEVTGGWNGDLVWGTVGEDEFAVGRGRLVAKTAHGWRPRGRTLPSGAPAPFALQPQVLFALLQKLPAAARKVVAVEAGEVGGKPVAILTLALADEAAADFANSGALPPVSGGPLLHFGAMMGGEAPEKHWLVDCALFVDAGNGDVLRVRAKVYEEDPMLAHVRFQIGGPGGGGAGGDEDDDKDDAKSETKSGAKDAKADGAPKVKKGLPDRKPGKTQSVMYAKIDFKNLGLAEVPALDDEARGWLGLEQAKVR
jgi:hypothetical protein